MPRVDREEQRPRAARRLEIAGRVADHQHSVGGIAVLEGVLVLRLLLAVVFAIAGGAKLVDPTGTRTALRQFGV